MTDSHVHVGWFVDQYHSPDDVTIKLRQSGVERVLVSSTSTCAEEYDLVLHEFEWLTEEWGENIIPALWVTPQMIETGALEKLLNSGIQWKAIKMHWHAHSKFFEDAALVNHILNDYRTETLPVLLHTGNFPECHAAVFSDIICKYPAHNFILAHGRPLDEAKTMLQKYDNVFVDTAFMPISDVSDLVKCGWEDRILWGSDCPINEHFYPESDIVSYLDNRIGELSRTIPANTFTKVTDTNFNRLFNNILN